MTECTCKPVIIDSLCLTIHCPACPLGFNTKQLLEDTPDYSGDDGLSWNQ